MGRMGTQIQYGRARMTVRAIPRNAKGKNCIVVVPE